MRGVTLFSAPKPFLEPHIGLIQINAASSWMALGPEVEVLWIGDEPGLAKAAAELGVKQLAPVGRNTSGTPLVSSVFELAQQAAHHDLLGYVNADILLLDDFVKSVDAVANRFHRFLIVGQRWDLAIGSKLAFTGDWSSDIRKRLGQEGHLHPLAGSDYFVFPRGSLGRMPEFAIGRAGWDNWMIYAARRMGLPVIDASQAITAVHQNHDYAHLPNGKPHYGLPESEQNVRLAGGHQTIFTLADATWQIAGGEIEKIRWPRGGVLRALEAAITSRAGSAGLLRVVRILFHPLEFLRSRSGIAARWIRSRIGARGDA